MFQGFFFSLLLHLFFLGFFLVQLPFFNEEKEISRTAGIVVVDLKSMKTTKETVLPPLRSSPPASKPRVKETTAAAAVQTQNKAQPDPKQPVQSVASPKTAAVRPTPLPTRPVQKPKPSVSSSKAVVASSNRQQTEKQPPKPAKPQRPPAPQEPQYDLQSLLASVEKLEPTPAANETTPRNKEKNNGNGRKGDSSPAEEGSGSSADALAEATIGAYSLQSTGLVLPEEVGISDKDRIGLMLRECWNLDAGVRGIENMIIDIKVSLDRSGQIQDVSILNQARYKQDATFRSVAESARRAVYICGQRDDGSPFKILAQNYASSYSQWKELLLKFDPLSGGLL